METHTQAPMALTTVRLFLLAAGIVLVSARSLVGQQDSLVVVRNDSLIIRIVDADLRAAVRALGRHLDRPIVFGAIGDARVTLETPEPVVRSDLEALLRGMLKVHGRELVTDSAFYRIEPARPERDDRLGSGPLPPDGPIGLFVIRLRHAAAADVAATVNALYGQAAALGELRAAPATLSEELRENRVPPVDTGSERMAPSVTGARPATLAGEVTIVPDPGTNSLLIRASPRDFELIKAAVEQLDVRPLQVLIEVLIVEVRRDRSYAFGLDLGLDTTSVPGISGAEISGHNTGLGLGDFVLKVMNIGGVELNATLRAAAGRGDVTIVSRPVLLAANNATAQILVGSQRPFVQVSRSLPTDVPTRDQVIQYKDVGTKLTVHPTISADGYIMLEVTQEVNSATSETAFNAPVISTRSIQTRLLVKDGQTIVLGGLTDRQEGSSDSGIPILSSIPLIGGLFGSSSRRATATELLLFLTPQVISSDADVNEITDPLKQQAEEMQS